MSSESLHLIGNFVSSRRNISILLGSEPEILISNDSDSTRSAFCPRGLVTFEVEGVNIASA